MAVLEWDKVGERSYQSGVNRGVLYPHDGPAVVWNGLTGVEDSSTSEVKSYYQDGIKILERVIPGDYSGKLNAFTYPDEFDDMIGVHTTRPGLSLHDQAHKSFNLSYRTHIGDDVNGSDAGYKIHLLYNIIAVPDSQEFRSRDDSNSITEFSWTLTGTPVIATDIPSIISGIIPGNRPTSHISIDSTQTDPEIFQNIEDILYGTEYTEPRLISIDELLVLFGTHGSLIIIDNGDGTWTAVDNADDYISMIDSTTFEINGANALYVDTATYKIASTDPPIEEIVLEDSSSIPWTIDATDDGTIDITEADLGSVISEPFVLESPNGDVWNIIPTTDGTLEILPADPGITGLYELRLRSSSLVWAITATDDGHLNIDPA